MDQRRGQGPDRTRRSPPAVAEGAPPGRAGLERHLAPHFQRPERGRPVAMNRCRSNRVRAEHLPEHEAPEIWPDASKAERAQTRVDIGCSAERTPDGNPNTTGVRPPSLLERRTT